MSDYRYIGKDGKTVLARDLEDERDALRARLEAVELGEAESESNLGHALHQLRKMKARAERAEAALEATNEGLTAAYFAGVTDEKARQVEALATARRDALEEAAEVVDAFRVELHTSVPAVEHSDTDALTFAADRIRALANEAPE